MDAKVFDFIEWDRLVFTWFGIRREVFLRVRPECSNIDFSRGNSSMWVNLPGIQLEQKGASGLWRSSTTTATQGS